MSRVEILSTIAELATDKGLVAERPLDESLRLVEDLALDSIALLTLAVAVEDRFRIALDEADEEAIRTLGDLISVVEQKLRG